MPLLEFIVVGSAAGWIMGKIRRGRGYGLIGNLVVGAIGSVIGWFLVGLCGIRAPNVFAQISMAVAGAIVLFLVLGLLKSKMGKKTKEKD